MIYEQQQRQRRLAWDAAGGAGDCCVHAGAGMREGCEHGVNRRNHMMHIEKSRIGKGWVAHLSGAWRVMPDRDWKRYAKQWRCVLEWDGRTRVLVARTLRELDARLQALANCTDSVQ